MTPQDGLTDDGAGTTLETSADHRPEPSNEGTNHESSDFGDGEGKHKKQKTFFLHHFPYKKPFTFILRQ